MKSEYLIISEINESYVGIIVTILVAVFLYFRGQYWKKNGNAKAIRGSNIGIAVFLCFGVFIAFTDTVPFYRMKSNYKEVVGTTKGREWNGKKYKILYTYEYLGTPYESYGSTEYFFNNSFSKPTAKDGMYVVIIDSLRPSRSLIDFNRKLVRKKADNTSL